MQERDEDQKKASGYVEILRCAEAEGKKSRGICRKSEVYDAFGNANIPGIYAAERMLEDYLTMQRILERTERILEERGEEPHRGETSLIDGDLHLRAQMYEIRRMIFAVPDDDAKLYLYYRYIYGETIERCAEMLSVSRATVYRIRRRALLLFSELMVIEQCNA